MTILGLDFDNTLVTYDDLFYRTAFSKGLIEESTPANKKIIRDRLRSKKMDNEFTLLQGEVYGSRITEASPSEGMLEALINIKRSGIKLCIISHKTQYPYKGEKYDLHKAALRWLKKNKFFDSEGLGMERSEIYFQATKEEKVKRIEELGCDYYIDDLVEILEMINSKTKKILYDPKNGTNSEKYSDIIKVRSWSEIEKIMARQNNGR
tara:strand:+ start:3075 stop:3698 length:624 start_codon:yes stop_codon:yes gene_type:complete